ncbi:PIN domain-like protein [Suillus bovinus]|uniref:PIN domain-like protein n=1 Tax=Suillus bovinus TaxID=48563 RepID=UPI001B871A08|nr:PIN domain-like protein [Suillus bovinus]KAG2146592.1 PIN domain-like protein [Suillus bovinus]
MLMDCKLTVLGFAVMAAALPHSHLIYNIVHDLLSWTYNGCSSFFSGTTMGINHLWEVLDPAATTDLPLTCPMLWALMQDAKNYECSGWFEQCQQGKWQHVHSQTGMNPALRTFLFRLAWLACFLVQLIFCYDGDQRPEVKRVCRMSTRDHWMVKPTQRILNAFNTQWITAAGEAEAQLALMNNAGIINAVMTDDSDIFVFGAKTVIRNSTFSSDATIKIGLAGCGPETALCLVHCMNISILAHDGIPLDEALKQWRDAARYHLTDDPTGKLSRAHPALARSLTESFPDPNVINLYAQPAVTPLAELPAVQSPALPDLAPLALVIQQLLGWEPKKLVSTFHSTIWPVVVLHEMLKDLANNSPTSDEVC